MRTFTICSVATVAFLAALPAATATPGEVLTRSGPGSTTDDAFVTFVGCESFDAAVDAPGARLNLGPGAAPLGRRSLGLVPAATGTASGPFAGFTSLADVGAGVFVTAQSGTSGVSYVWAITPDVLPGTAWSGRAALSVPAGGWHEVTAGATAYDWSLVDLATRRVVGAGGRATPGEFAATHGDGAGYAVTGFGCDGHGFNIDAVRTQAGVLDFEAVSLTTSVEVSRAASSGDTVVVSGSSRDATGRMTGDPLVLETRPPGGTWVSAGEPILADDDGVTRTELVVTGPTEVRWHRPESQYADEGWSDHVLVQSMPPDPSAGGQ